MTSFFRRELVKYKTEKNIQLFVLFKTQCSSFSLLERFYHHFVLRTSFRSLLGVYITVFALNFINKELFFSSRSPCFS